MSTKISTSEAATKTSRRPRMIPIGEWLVQRSRVSELEVERALQESQERKIRVGDALVHLGLLNRESIEREIELRKQFLAANGQPRVEDRVSPAAALERCGDLIGSSPVMRAVYDLIAKVGPSELTVRIEGETGTGKELVAAEIHRRSPRAAGPYLVVDCGSLPPNLVEAELFGHERGAFTGAEGERAGVFERARGGTVFLDEIGELPLHLQTRLLRVIDQRTIKRVGGSQDRPVDVRIIVATKRNLARMVERSEFRQDLYYRLDVVAITLPQLVEREGDIELLARHFLAAAGCADPDAVLTPAVQETLRAAPWAGNVRELRNLMEKALVLAGADPGELAAALVEQIGDQEDLRPGRGDDLDALVHEMPEELLDKTFKTLKREIVSRLEKVYFSRLARQHGTNVTRIAQAAGIDRHLVRTLMRKHGLKEEASA